MSFKRHSRLCFVTILSALSIVSANAPAQGEVLSKDKQSQLFHLAISDQGEWSQRAKAALEVHDYLENKKSDAGPADKSGKSEDDQKKMQQARREQRERELARAKAQWNQLKIDDSSEDYRRGLEVVAEEHLRKISHLALREHPDRLAEFEKIFAGTKAIAAARSRHKQLQAIEISGWPHADHEVAWRTGIVRRLI